MILPNLFQKLRESILTGVFVGLIAVTANAEHAIPDKSFRDLVVFNHFDLANARQLTIGIETEAGGLTTEQVIKSLTASLGGKYTGTELSGTETAHIIEGSRIGKIKVEPVNLTRLLNRYEETHPNTPLVNAPVRGAARTVDKIVGTFEIVTEPLNYDQVEKYAAALDDLGLKGAKGTRNFVRLVSTQVNVGIDPSHIEQIKQTLVNYYDNSGVIREDVKPALSRQGYLNHISKEFLAKLKDPSWHPTSEQLYDEYTKGSAHKLARLNFFNALLMDPDNFSRFEQPAAGKAVIPRPVAEYRESNTIMSTRKDPTASSRKLMQEVDFAVSMQMAGSQGIQLSPASERQLALRTLESDLQPPSAELRKPIRFRSILDEKYYVPLQTLPVQGASVLMTNPEILSKWDISGNPDEMEQSVLAQFSREVDVSSSPGGTRSSDPAAPFATAHNDGAGGRGDGRAFSYDEINGSLPSAKGTRTTPYAIKKGWATALKLHTGGTDGMMNFKESVKSWLMGEILHSFDITSERAAAIIDNHNFSTAEGRKSPSAIMVRELPAGGIRNSHIHAWDKYQTRRGLEYLKDYAYLQTGKTFTDTSFVAFDAVRTAKMAARMQDLYVVHGALAKGNVLAYPGLVDIASVSFLEKPNPEYTSFAYLSRFGNQTNRFRELMEERHSAYAKTNPLIKDVKSSALFNEAFDRELSLLTLERLGFTRPQAQQVFSKNPEKAVNFTKNVWDRQFGRLETDMRGFLSRAASATESYRGGQANLDDAVKTILASTEASEAKNPEGRRPWIGDIKNQLHQRERPLAFAEAKELLVQANEIIAPEIREGSVTVRSLASRAEAALGFRPPAKSEFDKTVSEITKAHKNGENVKPLLENTQGNLADLKRRMRMLKTADSCIFDLVSNLKRLAD